MKLYDKESPEIDCYDLVEWEEEPNFGRYNFSCFVRKSRKPIVLDESCSEVLVVVDLEGFDCPFFGVLTNDGIYVSDSTFFFMLAGEERKLKKLIDTIGPYKALEFFEL
jgi:hypothetical protein